MTRSAPFYGAMVLVEVACCDHFAATGTHPSALTVSPDVDAALADAAHSYPRTKHAIGYLPRLTLTVDAALPPRTARAA